MPKRPFNNRLNDLDPKSWLKFQKSWFVHNPPRRRKDVLRHPAKFPETLAQEFIEFFTKRGQVVLDPMAGTGSTLVAALRAGRHSYGIELNPEYAAIARQVIADEKASLEIADGLISEVITGDAASIERDLRRPCYSGHRLRPHFTPLLGHAPRPGCLDSKKPPRLSTPGCHLFLPSRRSGQHQRLRRVCRAPGMHLRGAPAEVEIGRLPDDHRQERQEGRQAIPTGVGPCPAPIADLYAQG